MNWIELVIHTTTVGSDWVSDCLMELGATGTMIEDKADIPDPSKPHGIWEIIDPKLLDDMPEDVLVHAWFVPDSSFPSILSGLQGRLDAMRQERADFGSLLTDTRTVSEDSWAEVWKKYYKPFYAGDHLVIKPTWEDFSPAPGDRVIEIDPWEPAAAFSPSRPRCLARAMCWPWISTRTPCALPRRTWRIIMWKML